MSEGKQVSEKKTDECREEGGCREVGRVQEFSTVS